MSEPRRLAAETLYNRIRTTESAMFPNECSVNLRLGKSTRQGPTRSRITYATAGYIFHRYVQATNALSENYTHVILDEVHERGIESDLVCFILKQLLQRDPSIKVILMSATPNTTLYQNYFSEFGLIPSIFGKTCNFYTSFFILFNLFQCSGSFQISCRNHLFRKLDE